MSDRPAATRARGTGREWPTLALGAAVVVLIAGTLHGCGRGTPVEDAGDRRPAPTTGVGFPVSPGSTSPVATATSPTSPGSSTSAAPTAPPGVADGEGSGGTEPEPVTEIPPPAVGASSTGVATTSNPSVSAVGTAALPGVPPPVPEVSPGVRSAAPAVFRGVGTWVDVYEWSPSVTKGSPRVTPAAVAEMADAGVQTLYLQSARTSGSADVTDEPVFREFVTEAHARGMEVVAWYLPTHVDPARDLRRLRAAALLGVDGIGVDIEGTSVDDVAERNRRLVQLSADLRSSVGVEMPLAAIVFSPLGLVLKPATWPNFPWREIAPYYDVWMPMGYWTFRRDETPEWDDGGKYTAGNFRLLAELTGEGTPAVHTIGGLAEDLLPGQAEGMAAAVIAHGGIGASLYSWSGTRRSHMEALQVLRRP